MSPGRANGGPLAPRRPAFIKGGILEALRRPSTVRRDDFSLVGD